jgi:hypothetical protein
MREDDDVSGLRFMDDPLVTVSGQFPLSPAEFSVPESSECPSGPQTRPFALRWLVEMGLPSVPTSYRYCPLRQVAVDAVTGEPRPPLCKVDWTTIAHKDNDRSQGRGRGAVEGLRVGNRPGR